MTGIGQQTYSKTAKATDGWFGVFAFLASAAWAIAAFVAIGSWIDFSDRRDSFDISAIQISQLADEMIVLTLPFFVVAVGLTAITVMIGLGQMLNRAASRVEIVAAPQPTTARQDDEPTPPTLVTVEPTDEHGVGAPDGRRGSVIAAAIGVAAVAGLVTTIILNR